MRLFFYGKSRIFFFFFSNMYVKLTHYSLYKLLFMMIFRENIIGFRQKCKINFGYLVWDGEMGIYSPTLRKTSDTVLMFC